MVDSRKPWEYRGVKIEPAGIFGSMGRTYGMVSDYKDFGRGPRSRWWCCYWHETGQWIHCETKDDCRQTIDKIEARA